MLRRITFGAAAVTSLMMTAPAVAAPAPKSPFNRFHNHGAQHRVHVTSAPNWSGLTKAAKKRNPGFTAPAVAPPYTPKPPVYPGPKGFACNVPFNAPTMTTNDSYQFGQRFKVNGTQEFSLTETCSGSTGPVGTPSVTPDCGSSGQSLGAYATFADGEYVDSCSLPITAANTIFGGGPVASGFRCEVTVGVGSDGNTPMKIHTVDSVEYALAYSSSAASYPLLSITTACVGKLPAGTVIKPKIKTHVVKCKEIGPTGPVYASGLSTVFPDGQYSETCTQPGYPFLI